MSSEPGFRDLIGMGTTIAVLVAGGLGLGLFIDSRVVTSPVFTLIGVGLGVISASFYLYFVAKKYGKD